MRRPCDRSPQPACRWFRKPLHARPKKNLAKTKMSGAKKLELSRNPHRQSIRQPSLFSAEADAQRGAEPPDLAGEFLVACPPNDVTGVAAVGLDHPSDRSQVWVPVFHRLGLPDGGGEPDAGQHRIERCLLGLGEKGALGHRHFYRAEGGGAIAWGRGDPTTAWVMALVASPSNHAPGVRRKPAASPHAPQSGRPPSPRSGPDPARRRCADRAWRRDKCARAGQ